MDVPHTKPLLPPAINKKPNKLIDDLNTNPTKFSSDKLIERRAKRQTPKPLYASWHSKCRNMGIH